MIENKWVPLVEANSKKVIKRKQYSQEEREYYYEKYKSSGQSKNKFCLDHDLPIATLHRWVAQLDSNKTSTAKTVKPLAWKAIKVESPAMKLPAYIELHLSSKYYLRLPPDIQVKWLKELLTEIL